MWRITQNPEQLDAKAIGLKSGIEIHQQLATRKLFCHCPSIIQERKPDFEIVRLLRASAGESGLVDQAALHETRKQKKFRYHCYHDSTCLVELDEEPPHEMSPDAVNVAVQVAKMLGCEILPKAQVMRKTVVDGSNTAGFQRTCLLAMGGAIIGPFGKENVNTDASTGKTNTGKANTEKKNMVRIQTICLEEEAAKIVARGTDEDTYNLSRLGIPLVEIATEPDLTSPEMVRNAAAHIGLVLRSTRKVRRGLGTIRQDVNISIAGGSRVEIKGAQDLRTLPTLVRYEMARQAGLLALAKLLKSWKAGKIIDVSKECKNTKGFVGKAAADGGAVIGACLPGLKGLLGTELFPGYRVGTELAGYAKANGFGGLIHADEEEKKYGLDFSKIKKRLGCGADDSFVLLVGDELRARGALEHVLLPRIKQFGAGVPQEVRKANADGSTTYLRPMPGAARMYPETDVPDVVIDTSKVKAPKLLTEQIADFAKKYSLPGELAKEAIEEPLFEELKNRFPKLKASFIASSLITSPKEIKKREKRELSADQLAQALPEILEAFENGSIPKGAVYELLVDEAYGRELDFSRFGKVDAGEVEKIIDTVIKADPKAPIGALMGQAMAKLRGKADGKLVMDLLKKKL